MPWIYSDTHTPTTAPMKRIAKKAAGIPMSKDDLASLMTETIRVQTDKEKLIAERDQKVAELSKPYDRQISELLATEARNLELMEGWADANRPEFGEVKSLVVAGHTVGWRLGNWKTALKSKTRWADVMASLKDWFQGRSSAKQAAAKEWIRVKEEPDKERMIQDRNDDTRLALLTELGVEIVQDETFYFAPAREGQQGAVLTA